MKKVSPEIIRKIVLNFLMQRKGKRFSVKQLHAEINQDMKQKIHYQTLLNYIDMMAVYGEIKVENYSSLKLVWYE